MQDLLDTAMVGWLYTTIVRIEGGQKMLFLPFSLLVLFIVSLSLFFIGFIYDVDWMISFFSKTSVFLGIILMCGTVIWGILEIIKIGGLQ